MKKVFTCMLLLVVGVAFAQPGKKPAVKQKGSTQTEMNRMIEEGMKGMSADEKADMRKMMKGVMPALQDKNYKIADYPEFMSNKQLVLKKDLARISSISKKSLVQADISGFVTNLYNKLMAKGDAVEVALAKKVIALNPNANAVGSAAVLCMMQGHPQAAMALSMKAVQTDPSNVNWQNNMASLLTQYGYAEQAIPVLEKLKKQFPRNSTVLNNLGQAWLALGAIDSAEKNIKRAGGLNPYHPEAKETEGIIEETNGNTEKAADDYVKAIENAISPFTENLIKNNKGENGDNKIDFEKLRRSITIYEYFPKDWIKIPKLSDNVNGYESDMAQINGYGRMFEVLKTGLDSMNDKAGKKINSADDNDSVAFINEMASEMIKGLSMMSKPAAVVMTILAKYGYQLGEEYTKEHEALLTELSNEGKKIRKGAENDECPAYNTKINAFLGYANPRIRAFHEKHLERFRSFLNTTCTWVWYLAGNPKDLSMLHCINWTQAFVGIYEEAVSDLNVEWPGCGNHKGDGVAAIALPTVPDFTCPTIVRVPFGNDWQQLSNTVNNFDGNSLGIKQNANNPIPNSSIAYGADRNGIAEAGRDPFSKTANGSVTAGMVNDDELAPIVKIKADEDELAPLLKSKADEDELAPLLKSKADEDELAPLLKIKADDDELAPLLKIKADEDELAPIVKIQPEELTPLSFLDELEHRRKSKLAKELLTKMMTADCKNVKDSKDILKEANERLKQRIQRMAKDSELLDAELNAITDELAPLLKIKADEDELAPLLKIKADEDELAPLLKIKADEDELAPLTKIPKQTKKPESEIKQKETEQAKRDLLKKHTEKMQQESVKTLKDIQQYGLQPSISSGVQAPGTFTPVKGLFN
jgi:Flp pilus assembly protein TadD